ncbi:unnamed protein product, partial [Phaeothamnion confervicola]
MNVVIIGTSVAAGQQCFMPDGRQWEACSWPSRVGEWLTRRLPDVIVTITN